MTYNIDLDLLRGCVFKRFQTQTRFGEAMGWNGAKVTRVMRGYQRPQLDEIWRIAQICNLSDEDILRIFFATA